MLTKNYSIILNHKNKILRYSKKSSETDFLSPLQAPAFLGFLLVMTWHVKRVRAFLPTKEYVKLGDADGEYFTLQDIRRQVDKHFRECPLPI